MDSFPAVSPDGKSIAYSSDQNGKFEIYVKQLAPGGGELQLTNDGQQNFQPAWSPDGQRIAYQSKGRGGIWFVSALGGTPRRLTEFGANPAWSFDGSQIAFQSKASSEINQATALAPSAIWVVPSEGGGPRQVSQSGNPPGGHSSPSWSPDGKQIVFDASDYLVQTVWILNLANGATKRIDGGTSPFFDPDGKHVYYLSGGLSRIEISTDGTPVGEREIIIPTSTGSALQSPSMSADGKKIVYTAARILSNLWTIPLSPTTAKPSGPPAPFSQDTSFRTNLARFSPDGKRIALTRWRAGSSADIWVADADGKNLTQLTNNVTTDSQASWFPDGDKLSFLSDREKPGEEFAVWTVSIATGKEEKLFELGKGSQFAVLSPDGTQVAYNSSQNGVINVWVASLKTGERKQLTFGTELAGFPSWSPDGRWVAFENQVGGNDFLMLMPSSGGEAKQLTSGPGKSWPHSWSGDADKIAFAGLHDGVWNIYWYSISSKSETRLTNYTKLNAFARYPAWSPQGNQIVFEYAETTGNVWMAEFK
jgi:Tol biopolymer transport system component